MVKGETYLVEYERSGETHSFTGRVASDPADRVIYFMSDSQPIGVYKHEIRSIAEGVKHGTAW